MALHGNLQVNGKTIGIYMIRRTNRKHRWKNYFHYEWEYQRVDDLTTKHTGTVSHRYDDGAEVLVGKVLRAVSAIL